MPTNETVIDINVIIDEVARRHKIRLAEDDPILATVTINDHVHKIFAQHLERLVEGVANQATDRLAAQIEVAKAAASKLVNDAGTWSAENLKTASEGAADDIKAAVSTALDSIQADMKVAHSARTAAIWAAAVTLIIGGAFFGSALGFWMAGRFDIHAKFGTALEQSWIDSTFRLVPHHQHG